MGIQNTDGRCSKVEHCKNRGSCDNDPFQFHLTKKPNKDGKLSFPYDKDGNDNHYAIGRHEPDLLQCRVKVEIDDSKFKATVYNAKGKNVGNESKQLKKKNDDFTVKGLPEDLAIWLVEANTYDLGFNYGAASFFDTKILKYFTWLSDDRGVSKQFDKDGKYCTNKLAGSPRDLSRRVIECYFPCPEK